MPAYRQIQMAVEGCLESGKLKPGDRIWSERELASRFGVSLTTAWHAFKDLEREGRVERRRGAGAFVALARIRFNKLVSFPEHISAKGLVPHSHMLDASRGHVDDGIFACIGLAANAERLKLVGLRQADGQPLAIETCYASAEQFPGLREQPLDR